MFSNERLRNRRIELGLTQEEVGKVVGISRSAVQKHEKGIIINVYTSTVELFAKALKCSPAYLMQWTDDPNPKVQNTSATDELHILIEQLDSEDRAELRGMARQMLKADKYKIAEKKNA